MKKLLYFLVAIAILGVIISEASEVDIILDSMKGKPKKDLFKVYHFVYNKEYKLDSDEGIKRYKIFKENLKWIEARNTELGKEIFGITQFTDLTEEEFKKNYLMDPLLIEEAVREFKSVSNKIEIPKDRFDQVDEEDNDVARNLNQFPQVDYRKNFGPAKDQKSCGSCWAFAAMGAVEGNVNLKFNETVTLSEQYLVDCDNKDSGCNGGWPTNTFGWLKLNGVLKSEEFPYKAKTEFCKSSELVNKRLNLVQDFQYCEYCTKKQWADLLAKGPVVVAVSAGPSGLSNYKPKNGEAWVPTSCQKVDHAVLAVGVVNENGKDYLIVRNSWGPNWGINGYFKLSVDTPCGILDYAWLPQVQKHEPFPQPVCNTIYSDCGKMINSTQICDTGIQNFNQTLGTIAGEIVLNPKSGVSYYFFWQSEGCPTKKGDFVYETRCLIKSYSWETPKSYISAAPSHTYPPRGCIEIFEKPCFSGKRTIVCNNIEDISILGSDFKFGSISLSFTVTSIVLFENTAIQGNGFGIRRESDYDLKFYNLETLGYSDKFAKAKSLMIVTEK